MTTRSHSYMFENESYINPTSQLNTKIPYIYSFYHICNYTDYEGEENVEDDEEFFSEDDGYDPEAPEMLPYPRKDSITTSRSISKKIHKVE
ncbi:3332_t:CDS:2 [Entrophospora sp. SA101]|nr:3332_t:CDS:2 [Entrophospora sp. SA101]